MAGNAEEPITRKCRLIPSCGFLPAAQDFAFQRLAGAIIGQAALDAVKDSPTGQEARGWLLSTDCALLCDYLDLDFQAVQLWVKNGCPDWRLNNR